MPKAKKIGRPKLPKGHAKGTIVPVRLSEQTRRMLERAVRVSEHTTVSQLIRASLDESMRETNIHRILDELRKGKTVESLNLTEMDIRDIRSFDRIDLSAYRTDEAPVYGTRTSAKDIRELQRLSKDLPN